MENIFGLMPQLEGSTVLRLCLTDCKLNVFVMRLRKIKQDMQVIFNYWKKPIILLFIFVEIFILDAMSSKYEI